MSKKISKADRKRRLALIEKALVMTRTVTKSARDDSLLAVKQRELAAKNARTARGWQFSENPDDRQAYWDQAHSSPPAEVPQKDNDYPRHFERLAQ